MFSSELELAISPDSIRQYAEIAYKHLREQNSTLSVAMAGVDKDGNEIFGIRLVSDTGEAEWYDPQEESHALIGWDDEKDAHFELENKVLPQIGYAIYQRDLQIFHRCMSDIEID